MKHKFRLRWLVPLLIALVYGIASITLRLLTPPPSEIDILIAQSRQYAAESRMDDAIRAIDSAIALAPDDPALYVERGQRIILLYEWDRALADYDRALELDSDYADAYFYRGVLYASVPEAGDARAQAVIDFEQYLALAPDGAHADEAEAALAALRGS
jgi:tetratricopeptide (TPR) repeat protein